SCWFDWCIGNTANFFSPRGRHYYSTDLVTTLPFLQLAVGRMKLMELSLSAFLEQRKQLPQNERTQHEIRKLEETVAFIRRLRIKYQRVVRKRVREWSSTWRELLGNDVGPQLEKIELAFEKSVRKGRAQKIDLQDDVVFNEVKYLMSGEDRSKRLRDKYGEAIARLSGAAGRSRNVVMNEHVGVNSVAGRDHGSSSGHFQGLSQDTSRTMTEHGQTSSRKRHQRSVPGSSNLEYSG
ncbi:hypothetical protein SeLEV6574_g05662, partial [Synchytrium endobioticum]